LERHGSGFRATIVAALIGLTLSFTSGLSSAAQGNNGHTAHAAGKSKAKAVAQFSAPHATATSAAAPSASGAPASGAPDAGASAMPAGASSPAAPAGAPAAVPTLSPPEGGASSAMPAAGASEAPAGAPAAGAPAAAASPSAPPADFGSPPSGEVPILFNDHHVYSTPDRLKKGRVLSAIVRGSTVLVPLRSMFEQMGASVTFDPATKMVDVTKPGSDVKVQVGKPEVVVNGESRPLDVAPEIYKGAVVVPLRVLSEGMGAYVLWVAEKRTVVVRYLTAAIPVAPTTTPAPPPPPASSPAPLPTPVETKARSPYEHFIVGDYVFQPKVYNELSPGNKGYDSFRVNGAIEFPLFNLPWMLEGDYRHFRYAHNQTRPTVQQAGCPAINEQACVQQIGPPGSPETFVPFFSARDSDFEGRLGLKIAEPRIYIGIGFVFRSNNYQYPIQRGLGFGLTKLPDLDARFSVYGSAMYFPQISGDFIDPASSNAFKLQYRLLKFDVGATFRFTRNSPFFLDVGYYGDKLFNKQNAPSDITEDGLFAGLGLTF